VAVEHAAAASWQVFLRAKGYHLPPYIVLLLPLMLLLLMLLL
jgi:hypothetical protein